jgi:hypothetical protein
MQSAQFSTVGISLVVLSLGPAAAGCAASPPTRELVDAQTAIHMASHVSKGNSSASLDRAVRKAALARQWMAAGDHRPARWLAEQARVDADLAAAQAE